MGTVSVIAEGQRPDGTYAAPRLNSNNELIVAGSVGGGSSAIQISDGSTTATITDVLGKKSLDVNVTDITLDHANDTIRVGDGTNLISSTLHNGVRGLNVSLANTQVPTVSVAYKSLIDEVSSSVSYIGKAVAGSSTSDPVWQIQRITISGSLTAIEYAAGTTSFNQVWSSRAGLSYS